MSDESNAETHVFLSYSREDSTFANRISRALQTNGFSVWVDTDYLKPSQRFWEKIDAAIDEAAAFIPLISPNSAVSKPCARETQRALNNKQQIVPILWREVKWTDGSVREAFRNIRTNLTFANFTEPKEFESSLKLLVRSLRNEWEDAEESALLRTFALNWENRGRSPGSTLNLDQIRRFVEWIAGGTGRIKLTGLQREFLQASQEKVEEDRKKLEDALVLAQTHEREALKRESLMLAAQSRTQTASGRADLGVKLALAALPRLSDSVTDRPIVKAAETALFAAVIQSRFRLAVEGRQETLVAAGMSPNGERAVLSYDSIGGPQTELWNLKSGENLKAYSDAYYSFKHAAFSPDGRLLALGYVSGYGTLMSYGSSEPMGNLVQIVDARTGEVVTKFSAPGQKSTFLQFSPSGGTLVVVTDEMLVLLDTSDWQSGGIPVINDVTMACFSEDESKIALLTRENACWIIRRDTKEFSQAIRADVELAGIQLVGESGKRLVMATGSKVHWIDLRDELKGSFIMQDQAKVLVLGQDRERGAVIAITEAGRAHSWVNGVEQIHLEVSTRESEAVLRSATLNELGTNAIVEFMDGVVEFWDLSIAERRLLLDAEDRTLVHAEFDVAGSVVLIATSDNTVRVWDREAFQCLDLVLNAPGRVASAIGFCCKEDRLAIGYLDGMVEVRALEDGALVWAQEAAHRDEVLCVAFEAHGKKLVTTSADKTAAIWNLEIECPEIRLTGHEQLVSFGCFSPDGNLTVTSSSDSSSRLWDTSSGTLIYELALPNEYRDPIHNASILHQARYTSDGRRVITVSAGDGYNVAQPALVWDVRSGKLLHALKHEGAIWDVSLTPDERYVVTCSYDRTIRMWDLKSGEQHRIFSGHGEIVFAALVYSEGRLLASASADGTVRIWSVNSGSVVHILDIHEAPVSSLALSPDEALLATGSVDGFVCLWDATLGHLAGKLPVQTAPLRSLVFSADRRKLITRSETGAVQAWSLPPLGQALIDLAWNQFGKGGELLTPEQHVRFNLAERKDSASH